MKDEKGTFSPAVLESLGLDEGDIEGIRRAMEDTIVSEVGQIVSTCLAPTPSVARGRRHLLPEVGGVYLQS